MLWFHFIMQAMWPWMRYFFKNLFFILKYKLFLRLNLELVLKLCKCKWILHSHSKRHFQTTHFEHRNWRQRTIFCLNYNGQKKVFAQLIIFWILAFDQYYDKSFYLFVTYVVTNNFESTPCQTKMTAQSIF